MARGGAIERKVLMEKILVSATLFLVSFFCGCATSGQRFAQSGYNTALDKNGRAATMDWCELDPTQAKADIECAPDETDEMPAIGSNQPAPALPPPKEIGGKEDELEDPFREPGSSP